ITRLDPRRRRTRPRPARRLPGRGLRAPVPRASAAVHGMRACRHRRRAPSRDVDDVRGRDPRGAGQDARRALRAHPRRGPRRRLTALFDTGLALALRAAETEGRSGVGFAVSTGLTERFRTLVLEGPEGETHAAALAADASARLAAGDLQGVGTLVTRKTVN